MDLESIRAIFDQTLGGTLLPAMVILAAADFAAALVEHLRDGTFHGTLVGKWAGEKGIAIVSVAVLYAVDAATKFLQISVGDFDMGLFGAVATAQAGSFIASQGFSIVKHLQTKPVEEPVPDETTGG